MKVGIVSFHSFIHPGGVKRHIMGLFKQFKKRGIETKIIVPRRKQSEDYGKDIILLGTSFPMKFSGSQADFNVNFNPVALESALKEENFDVLHFHNFGFPSALQILLSPAVSDTLNILTFHANLQGSKFLEKFPRFFYLAERICQWKIDGIIGVSPLILEYFKNYDGPKVIIPNGIDIEKFNPQVSELERFSDNKTNILFVGRIEERKGLIYLLKSYKILQEKFSDLRLIIVGEGPEEEECQKYVKKHNLQEVVFEGEVEEGVASYYKTADIFVSPAIFGESFGLVNLEAMACGTPVAAFANQGYADLLRGTCIEPFLAPPKDHKALAEKIEALIRDPELRKEIGEKAIEEARFYSWSSVADQVLEFYEMAKEEKKKEKKSKISFQEIMEKANEIADKDILELLKIREEE
ncbi:MAG: glycosyltransferase [Candidatus Nealsonbacteria bacterium]|nr:glycosyltransferase [Candidatus Nealsonbacteria bacterium]